MKTNNRKWKSAFPFTFIITISIDMYLVVDITKEEVSKYTLTFPQVGENCELRKWGKRRLKKIIEMATKNSIFRVRRVSIQHFWSQPISPPIFSNSLSPPWNLYIPFAIFYSNLFRLLFNVITTPQRNHNCKLSARSAPPNFQHSHPISQPIRNISSILIVNQVHTII